MSTGADGVDVLEPEVELEVGVNEGSNEAPRGRIDVQPDVPSILLVQLLCNNKQPFDKVWELAAHTKP